MHETEPSHPERTALLHTHIGMKRLLTLNILVTLQKLMHQHRYVL